MPSHAMGGTGWDGNGGGRCVNFLFSHLHFLFSLFMVIVHKINYAFSWAFILCNFMNDGVFP